MAYNFSAFKLKLREIEERFQRQLQTVRTGQVSPRLLDGVIIKTTGGDMPVNHLGSVALENQRVLRITPWDKAQIKVIDSSIQAANLGVSVVLDGASLRIIVPELTNERRQAMVKIVKKELEEARIALRREREKVWNDIQSAAADGHLSEDEKFKGKNDLQKLIDEANHVLDDQAARKEKEILG
ncbi:MAG: ribosome recycling factor [Patescibacteria group bacterium]